MDRSKDTTVKGFAAPLRCRLGLSDRQPDGFLRHSPGRNGLVIQQAPAHQSQGKEPPLADGSQGAIAMRVTGLDFGSVELCAAGHGDERFCQGRFDHPGLHSKAGLGRLAFSAEGSQGPPCHHKSLGRQARPPLRPPLQEWLQSGGLLPSPGSPLTVHPQEACLEPCFQWLQPLQNPSP